MPNRSAWDLLAEDQKRLVMDHVGADAKQRAADPASWPLDFRSRVALAMGKLTRSARMLDGPAPVRPAPKLTCAAPGLSVPEIREKIIRDLKYYGPQQSLDQIADHFFLGLDPQGKDRVRTVVKTLAREGRIAQVDVRGEKWWGAK